MPKPGVDSAIAFRVPNELCAPKGDSGFWQSLPVSALVTVPEAAVYKNDASTAWQDDVRFAGQSPAVEAEAIPQPMQYTANDALGPRVSAAHQRHALAPLSGGHVRRLRSKTVMHCSIASTANIVWNEQLPMATSIPSAFQVGVLYSSQDIQRALGVGNAGGIRLSVTDDGSVRRAVILTSVPTARQLSENPYRDRIESDILVYTGAGREGEQTLGGVNRRLPQQLTADFPAYGFVLVGSRRDPSVGPKRWQFLGLLEYVRHYPDTQAGTDGKIRKVWLFEMRIHSKPEFIVVADDAGTSARVLSESRMNHSQSGEDREIEEAGLIVPTGGVEFDPAEIEAIRGRLLAKPADRFEHFVKDLMLATGFVNVSVTKLSQDGGVDVNAYAGAAMWPVENMLVQVQAKRWLHTVGRKEVAELRGSLEPFARGAVVTTSHYSRAAVVEAASAGKAPIVLVDGFSLARIVRCAGLKVD